MLHGRHAPITMLAIKAGQHIAAYPTKDLKMQNTNFLALLSPKTFPGMPQSYLENLEAIIPAVPNYKQTYRQTHKKNYYIKLASSAIL